LIDFVVVGANIVFSSFLLSSILNTKISPQRIPSSFVYIERQASGN